MQLITKEPEQLNTARFQNKEEGNKESAVKNSGTKTVPCSTQK